MYRIRIVSSERNSPAHEAIALIDKKTYHPVQLRLRKGIVWITINIANFETGNWPDDMFQFNPKKYPKEPLLLASEGKPQEIALTDDQRIRMARLKYNIKD